VPSLLLTAGAVRDAVERVLHNSNFATTAGVIADEIAAMPSHADFAASLRTVIGPRTAKV
jgi:UDP:flavonoid glycosyltransferase YjiC (YdhE family)